MSFRQGSESPGGQTKTKLGNQDVKGIVDTIVSDGLHTYLKNIRRQRNYSNPLRPIAREKRHAGQEN
ncbi:MAG: hypothetical protein ACLUIQ_07995 [Dialister invisus]